MDSYIAANKKDNCQHKSIRVMIKISDQKISFLLLFLKKRKFIINLVFIKIFK